MARNTRRSRGLKKIEPAVMQMEFSVPAGVSYIDLNLCASIINRRAYKQRNTNWAVGSFEMLSANTLSLIHI